MTGIDSLRRWAARVAALLLAGLLQAFSAVAAPLPPDALPETVAVPAGPFLVGSSEAERTLAYDLDKAAEGSDVSRQRRLYAGEQRRGEVELPTFRITRTPITNRQYLAFVIATGHAVPDVDRLSWAGYRFVEPFGRARAHAWRDGAPDPARLDHPVVLVSRADAEAYALWLSKETGDTWRLPSEEEWEKAARGTDGRAFPWGNDWDPRKLNSADLGPGDSMPVGRFLDGASPYGMLDAAGEVAEWTASGPRSGEAIVKGGSWADSGCGRCRPAARQRVTAEHKHYLIGFRLLQEVEARTDARGKVIQLEEGADP